VLLDGAQLVDVDAPAADRAQVVAVGFHLYKSAKDLCVAEA
jgi:hypothetical protein